MAIFGQYSVMYMVDIKGEEDDEITQDISQKLQSDDILYECSNGKTTCHIRPIFCGPMGGF